MHEGHRQRMLLRLINSPEGLNEHELLEILLFNAIPRKNTNEIAHSLLNAFGSVSNVFRASFEELERIPGVGASTAAYLKCIFFTGERLQTNLAAEDIQGYRFSDFSEFLIERYRGSDAEVVEMFAIDGRQHVKSSVRISSNEQDRVRVAPTEITRFFAASKPSAIVLVHNHLCNNCNPSSADNNFTRQVQFLCDLHNVKLYDHIIVSPGGLYSYHVSGKLDEIAAENNFRKVFGGAQ